MGAKNCENLLQTITTNSKNNWKTQDTKKNNQKTTKTNNIPNKNLLQTQKQN